VRVAAAKDLTVVLAKRDAQNPADEVYFLFALRSGASSFEPIDESDDPSSRATRVIVDGAGTAFVATKSLAKVLP
jgi:hypothetical protein